MNGVTALATSPVVNPGGTLKLGGNGGDQIAPSMGVTINPGGTFDLAGQSETVDFIYGGGSSTGGAITNSSAGASTLTVSSGATAVTSNLSQNLSDGSGKLAVVLSGYGEKALTGNNTFTGGLTINGGSVNTGAEASTTVVPIFSDASLGGTSNVVTLNNGGTLFYGFTVNANGSWGAALAGTATLSSARTIVMGSGVGGVFRVNQASSTLVVNSLVTGSGGLTMTNYGGMLVLANTNNNYQGPTTIIGAGVIGVYQLGLAGSGPLGSSSNAAANLVFNTTNGGTLKYLGNGNTTDRLFTLSANGVIDNSGLGALNFNNTGAVVASGAGSVGLTLQGSYADAVNTFAPQITDGANGPTSLTKAGQGTWTVTNNNSSFTGGVNITGGQLQVTTLANSGTNSPLGAAGTITVSSGGMLNYTGTTASTTNRDIAGNGAVAVSSGTVTLASGSNYTGPTIIGNGTLVLQGPTGTVSPGSIPGLVEWINAGNVLGTGAEPGQRHGRHHLVEPRN